MVENQPSFAHTPPPDAYEVLGNVISELNSSAFQRERKIYFPNDPEYSESNMQVLPSFRRPGMNAGKYTVPANDAVGLAAITEGVHATMRGQVKKLHIRFIDEIIEQYASQSVFMPKERLMEYGDAVKAIVKNLKENGLDTANLELHRDEIEAIITKLQNSTDPLNNGFTLADQLRIFVGCYQFTDALFQATQKATPEVKKTLLPLRKQLNSDFEVVSADLSKHLAQSNELTLTLHDAQNQPITVTVPNVVRENQSAARIIVGAISGGGLFDEIRVLPSQTSMLTRMLGQTTAITLSMQGVCGSVRKALKAKGYDDAKTEEILQSSGMGISNKTWGMFRDTLIRQNIAQACFESYVIRFGKSMQFCSDDSNPEFYDELIGPYTHKLCNQMQIPLPKENQLAPCSRRDYAAVLCGIDERMKHVGASINDRHEMVAEAEEHKALGNNDALIAKLLSVPEAERGTRAFLSKKSSVQEPPSEADMKAIRTRIEALRSFASHVDAKNYDVSCLSKLLEIATRGIEGHGQGSGRGGAARATG